MKILTTKKIELSKVDFEEAVKDYLLKKNVDFTNFVFNDIPRIRISLSSSSEEEHEEIKVIESPTVLQEMDEEAKEKFLDSEISMVDFSLRAYNCLRSVRITTFRQLISYYSDNGLGGIRNLGKITIKEIKEVLINKGFKI